jgi:hypothetical protein
MFLNPWASRLFARGAIGAVLAVAWVSPAAAQEASEPALKAAYLYNFIRFTEWPADESRAGGPLDVCVTNGAVAQALEPLAGKAVDGRPIAVHRVVLSKGLAASTLEWLRKCEVLYVDDAGAATVSDLLRQLKGRAVLTVGDRGDFTAMGGVVRFYLDRGRLRFEINQGAALQENLRLSAQVLQLARPQKE